MKSNLGISLCILLSFLACFSIEEDTLSRGDSLTENQTLVSKDGIFELGFFKTGTLSYQRIYLGIWYKDFPEKNVVWVANRDKSLPEGLNSELKILPNGNLGLYHDVDSFWSTNLMSNLPDTTEAILLDNGNLILRDASKQSTIYWQSFDDPTHVWLPGASLGFNRVTGRRNRLVSWRNEDDPAPGLYSVEVSENDTFQIFLEWNISTVYWKSGVWNGFVVGSVTQLSYLMNFKFVKNKHETYFSYSVLNPKVFSMLVINPSGELQQVTSRREDYYHKWDTTVSVPESESEILGFCGPFGIFGGNSCSCLHGFVPFSSTRPRDGCVRKSTLECRNGGSVKGMKDGFLGVSGMKFPVKPIANGNAHSGERCRLDCLMNCSCTAYAFNENGCSIWDGDLYDIQNVSNNRHILYVKLAGSDLPTDEGKRKTVEVIVAVVVPVVVLVFAGCLGWFYTRRTKRKENKKSGADLLSFDFDSRVNTTDDGTNLRRRNDMDFDLPTFNYASISAATTKFSPENKLGEGGFGPVYKGKLLNGQEVALKKLSEKSSQGFQEFRNEVSLIAKLQHRNLVRLLGCCIDPNESILIYEYLPNKSLDLFLFDSNKHEILDWTRRVHIIEGIAQGILYLHEHSRVRIIHRDLKASNILLDGDMNPKISDFGMARIFGGNDSRAHTRRIVGTYGYMAPEYALEGLFSVKSDVFSFGVLVLEIISGKRNTGFYNTDSLNLIRYAWELWISDRGAELVDHKMGSPRFSMALRYINVGLLCVQENPNDRPSMSSVVSMLSSEIAALPAPKQPAFTATSLITSTSVKNSDGKHSVNGLTMSTIEPR